MYTLKTGELLRNRYQVLRMIAQGGQSRIYLAVDLTLSNRQVVIKELLVPAGAVPADRNQIIAGFQREASLLGNLSHPALPSIYDFFDQTGQFYIVMAYIQGETLEERLNRAGGGLPEDLVTHYAQQLGDVLSYLHSQNPPVVFRDLKPGNIMVDQQNRLFLIDFGIARFFRAGKSQDTVLIGTPGYAPPEQYGRGQTDPRSDVYALGVTLLELLTGVNPEQYNFNMPHVHQIRPDVSNELAEAIYMATRVQADQRPQSVRQFLGMLPRAVTAQGVGPTPAQPSAAAAGGGAPSWLIAAGAFIGTLLACGVIGGAGLFAVNAGLLDGVLPAAPTTEPAVVVVTTAVPTTDGGGSNGDQGGGTLTPATPDDGGDGSSNGDGGGDSAPSATPPPSQTALPPTTAPSDTPPPPPPSGNPDGQIVYTCYDGFDNICIMDADGSNQRQLTNYEYSTQYGSIAPDGDVVFSSQNEQRRRLYRMSPTGGNIRAIVDGGSGAQLYAPEVSRDGDLIVYARFVDGQGQDITVTSLNSGNTWTVFDASDEGVSAYDPVWSPDGSQILFTAGEAGVSRDLYVADADGSNRQRLTSRGDLGGRNDWSPDGRTVAFYAGSRPNRHIYTLDITTGSETRVTSGGDNTAPSFSPDGQYIVYMSFDSNDNAQVFRMRLSDRTTVQLTRSAGSIISNYQPRWSPP